MTVFIGWIFIIVVVGFLGALLLWPAFRLVSRSNPRTVGSLCGFAAAITVLGIGIWLLIPIAVHALFGGSGR